MPINQPLEQDFFESQPDLQYMQCTYNAALRPVRVTVVAAEKQ